MTVELEGKCRKVNKIIIFYRSQFIFSQHFKLSYFVTILEMWKIKDRCDCWSCIHSKNLEFATAIVVDDHFLTFSSSLPPERSFIFKQTKPPGYHVLYNFIFLQSYPHLYFFPRTRNAKDRAKVIFWQKQSRGNDWSSSPK